MRALTKQSIGEQMPVELWISGYIGIGVLWGLWNSTSRTFRTVASNANVHGQSWALLVAFMIGVFLWPIGLVTTVVLSKKHGTKHR